MKTKSMAILTAMCALALSSCVPSSSHSDDIDGMSIAEKNIMGQLIRIEEKTTSSRHKHHIYYHDNYHYQIDTDGNPETIEYTGVLKGSNAFKYAKVRNDNKAKPAKTLEEWSKQFYQLTRVY